MKRSVILILLVTAVLTVLPLTAGAHCDPPPDATTYPLRPLLLDQPVFHCKTGYFLVGVCDSEGNGIGVGRSGAFPTTDCLPHEA